MRKFVVIHGGIYNLVRPDTVSVELAINLIVAALKSGELKETQDRQNGTGIAYSQFYGSYTAQGYTLHGHQRGNMNRPLDGYISVSPA